MSSTNRGGERAASDYYVTPIPAIELFLGEWAKDNQLLNEIGSILDPCAGGTRNAQGDITTPMSYPEALHKCGLFPDCQLSTLDIRPDSAAVRIGDYLNTPLMGTVPDLIISNPPFALASEFIEKALQDVKPGGWVVMLLRLNFFESQGRKAFMQSNPPCRAYVHAERMSFTGGKTDSVAYMHAVWRSGYRATETKLRVI